ncbi:MAG: hypothetical protein ACI8XU_002511 [Kiritimatiellia bacterium]|jgi:hypothetical protein
MRGLSASMTNRHGEMDGGLNRARGRRYASVVTQEFNPQQSFRGASEKLTVTKEFSSYSDSQILYRFTVEDPTVFSEPFAGEMMMNARPAAEFMYEYACHEGSWSCPLY